MRYLKHTILAILGTAALAGCTKEKIDTILNGVEKTPVEVSALLDAADSKDVPGTKATATDFENGDALLAYLRHVEWDGSTGGARTLVTTDKSPLLATLTKGSSAMTAFSGSDITPIGTGVALGLSGSNTTQTTDLTATPALYWDDFSTGARGDATDIRTDGHYLQSYYGYCYNGGTPSTSLVNATGVLGWTVVADQTAGIKSSDLLWSAEQTPVDYRHAVSDRKGLVLPYTHAMSKLTLEIVLDEGFETNSAGSALAFGANATTPTVFVNKVTQTTAPEYLHSTSVAEGDASKVQMFLSDDEATTKKVRVYEAIIAPTVMKAGMLLSQITVDGNQYDIHLTDEILTTVPDGASAAWSSKLSAYAVTSGTPDLVAAAAGSYTSANGGITLPGVNYRIRITLKKQKIELTAYITDWEDVNASADGQIVFDADIVSSDVTGLTELVAGSFDLWRSETNSGYTDKSSTYTYNAGKWVGDPVLYWKNGSTAYYFRALATTTDGETLVSVNGDKSAEQGTDLLWATTSAHKTYSEGDAINPRTGDVPLTFKHALSKLTVELSTTTGADQVVLAGASVKIINLYTGGTIDVADGSIGTLTPASGSTTFTEAVNGDFKVADKLFIPQSLSTFEDGTAREEMAVYYTASELTKIYSDGTSQGTGSFTYYLTTDLDFVGATYYSDSEAKAYNAALPGAKHAGDKEYYTFEEWIQLTGHSADTINQFNALTEEEKTKHTYTQEEADDYNATLPGAVKSGDEKTEAYYKLPAGDAPTSHVPGEIKTPGDMILMFITLADGTLYKVLPADLSAEWKSGKHYIYNMTLAKDAIDFRVYIKDWEEVESSGTITPEW